MLNARESPNKRRAGGPPKQPKRPKRPRPGGPGGGHGSRISRTPESASASGGRARSRTSPPNVRPAGDEDEVVALSPIRRRIAARLVQSSQSIPRVTTAIEADMTPLAELRKQHRESYEKAGLKLSYMPFIMKAAVAALKESPAVNSSWGGEKLILS